MAQMQTTKVAHGIEFAYHDSGAPLNENYFTLIAIHGNTYHSGTFLPLLEAGKSSGYRVILPNRRLYPGSTPYTQDEADSLKPTNSPEDVAKAYLKQGEYLLLFVDNMIKEHGLKKVIVTGWSLGSGFVTTMICSITTVEDEVKDRLRQTIKAMICWDPPATVHGILDPPTGGWIPLYDETLTPEQRGQAFVQWLHNYYPHPNIEKKNCNDLIYKIATPVKTPTFDGVPFEEFLTKVDLTGGPRGDTLIGGEEFQKTGTIVRQRAFCNLDTRQAWGDVPFVLIYGDENVWPIIWAVWELEAEVGKAGLPLTIKRMPGVNHFGMYDHPQLVIDTIASCL